MDFVVNSEINLRKRILNFFESNDKAKSSLKYFLDDISLFIDPYIFGGAIRDIALLGAKKFYSDIDIVFERRDDKFSIESFLSTYTYDKNKFGGYRVDIEGWYVDIWEAKESWAFKNGITYNSITSLLNTTITNWDQALFDWNEKKLIVSKNYINDLRKGYLDLIFKPNPNPIGQSIKILHFYANKNAHLISNNMIFKIKEILDTYSYEELKDYEFKSYHRNYITKETYNFLASNTNIEKPDLLPIKLDNIHSSLDLF